MLLPLLLLLPPPRPCLRAAAARARLLLLVARLPTLPQRAGDGGRRGASPASCSLGITCRCHPPHFLPCSVLGMVDGAVLLVDANEGPLSQTKFVVEKAIRRGLR